LSQVKSFISPLVTPICSFAAVAFVLTVTALSTVASAEGSKEMLLENIKPVGQVYVAGENAPEPEPAANADAAAAAEPKSGEEIYNSTCMACHGTGAAGAPKVGDAAAWAPRIAKGIDGLLSSAINGLNVMPPRGTCATCSDADLKAAIEYMISKSQ